MLNEFSPPVKPENPSQIISLATWAHYKTSFPAQICLLSFAIPRGMDASVVWTRELLIV